MPISAERFTSEIAIHCREQIVVKMQEVHVDKRTSVTVCRLCGDARETLKATMKA